MDSSSPPPASEDPANAEPAPSEPLAQQPALPDPVILAPSYLVPLAISLAGALCIPLQPRWAGFRWVALALVAFGGLLLLQARTLRLEFAHHDLVVWRGEQEIRRFPYASWLGWRLFWPSLPVLFYFREVRSIHLLPVLFDPAELRQQLLLRLPQLAPPAAP
jgi:hypothetical protein